MLLKETKVRRKRKDRERKKDEEKDRASVRFRRMVL